MIKSNILGISLAEFKEMFQEKNSIKDEDLKQVFLDAEQEMFFYMPEDNKTIQDCIKKVLKN